MEYQFTFTVYTCTYNRAHLLPRLYESLKNQTFKDFEWIVYDNGSTDDTQSLVKGWAEEGAVDIKILHRPDNSGYQNAFNAGMDSTKGKLWTSLDSDDACIPTALQEFYDQWNSIPADQRSDFVGVTGTCDDQHGELVGEPYPSDPLDSNAVELKLKHKVSGEKWGCMRADILKQFPFPTHSSHVMPGVVWNQIARRYKTRYFNRSLRIYYINEGDRVDQITQQFNITKEYSYGRRVNSLDTINNDMKWFLTAPMQLLKQGVIYNCCSILQGLRFPQTVKEVNNVPGKLLTIVTFPAGFAGSLIAK